MPLRLPLVLTVLGSLALGLALVTAGAGGCQTRAPVGAPSQVAAEQSKAVPADAASETAAPEDPAAADAVESTGDVESTEVPDAVEERAPAPPPLAERVPPKLAHKKRYKAVWMGSWVFTSRMGSWLSKRGLQHAPHGSCPKRVPEVSFGGVGKLRETERSWAPWESFDGLTGDDYEAWFPAIQEALDHSPDLVVIMFGGKVDDMRTPAGETVSVERDEAAWLREYERRLALLITLLEPERRRILWLGMPDPAATGQVDRPWARVRDAQLRALEALGQPVDYLDMTPFMVDESGQIPKTRRVFAKKAVLRLDSEGNFRLSGTGNQWMIQTMTEVVLATLPIAKGTLKRCGLHERDDLPARR